MNYQEYIKNLNLDYSKAYGKCEKICKEMKEVFPELKLIRGHYYCIVWGERQHWWLEAEDGKVIDPTAIQFPSKGTGVYEPWGDKEEPTGKCPNCGEYTYNEYIHKECHDAFVASCY